MSIITYITYNTNITIITNITYNTLLMVMLLH